MTRIDVAIRQQVISRAGNCCEYCLLSRATRNASFHVEHIIAIKHRGETALENLCLSCPECNANKGSDLTSIDEETGETVNLYHPRKQQWDEHFRLNGGIIEPLTPSGRVTVFLLRFNDSHRIMERELMLKLGLYPCLSVDQN